ncbi:dynamin family protein [Neobacillus citreus]|uniref:Dynamin family protein n=1 Tax=Neobacillus citreus TaxID=2833578 RepID=A0A942YDR4_9BACI|nr:dynamin family protein [Neobacillus citreus]MCH6266999.1 dynamin family protein [Neobacillus citreus]
MKITVSEHQIDLTGKNIMDTISPYFYHHNHKTIIGEKVEKAINLFPEYIFNLFTERNETKVEAFFVELKHLLTEEVRTVHLHPIFKRFEKTVKRVYPTASVTLVGQKTEFFRKLPVELEYQFANVFVSTLTNEIIKVCHIPGRLYHKLNQIIRLRLPFYLKELMQQGKIVIDLKVIDYPSNVFVVREEFYSHYPSIQRLLDIYLQSYTNFNQVIKAHDQLYEGNFKVTFISPFSFGKSTLINGLLGEEMLNMDIRAETAIITKVVSADSNRILVKYDNNRVVMQPYEDMVELKSKLQDLTGVRSKEKPYEVQIHHHFPQLQGITIIDAPGLNSRHSDHNQIAAEAFQMSDLILFLINPAHIGEANFSSQIKEFLEQIKETDKKYGFILSKLDLYSDDHEVIMQEMKIVLKDLDPSYAEEDLFFISGYFALYGKLLGNDKLDLHEIRKNRGIFIIEEDEIIMGRGIEKHHASSLVEFSQIDRLEQFIRERGENHAPNKLNLDRRKPAAVGIFANP